MENKVLKIENNLYWLYLAGFFIILFLPLLPIPFVYKTIPALFSPLDWGKTIVFRIVISILLFFFVLQILYKKISLEAIKAKIKDGSKIIYALTSLFGIYLLSTFFSVNIHNTLWGDPFRAGGFVNFSFYIIFSILVFLVIKRNDWKKIWSFSIVIGILVSLIAIFQQLALFKTFLIPFEIRPGSTLGNPIFLGVYLLLLSFLSLSLGIESKKWVKKFFYFFAFFFFVFVSLFIAQTRAVFAGLSFGLIWFLVAYPAKSKSFRLLIGVILIIAALGMYSSSAYLQENLEIYQKMPPIVSSAVDRILSVFEGIKVEESRLSAWKLSGKTLMERPILGYGMENFNIAFDKFYDPSLPKMGWAPSGGIDEWWDRAHNIIFDISVTGGIPALLIYFALFGVLFWQLQKTKKRQPESALSCHAIQATLIGYLVANLFSFDTFSSYIVFFLLISYSLHLTTTPSYQNFGGRTSSNQIQQQEFSNNKLLVKLYPHRQIIAVGLAFILVLFIFSFNLKPLLANKNLNLAIAYYEMGKCGKTLEVAKKYSPTYKTIIDNYLRIRYVELIQTCTPTSQEPIALAQKAISFLKKNTENNQKDVRNWLLLAEYTNILIEEKNKETDNVFLSTPEMEQLKKEANEYFAKAVDLSPQRQEIYKEWLKTGIITGDYETAKERAQKCIDLNPNYPVCYWLMGLVEGYLGNYEKLNYFGNIAKEKGYDVESEEALSLLLNMYIRIGDYKGLAEVYPKIINITKDKNQQAQLYASLAVVYKELGEIKKAREAALKALELMPEAKTDVEEFLRSLEP
jgi:tetratricopeptide (TPR) repeat protein